MILNPDIKKRTEIIKSIKANQRYCPCLVEQSEDTKCKCKNMRENDICICGLYVKEK